MKKRIAQKITKSTCLSDLRFVPGTVIMIGVRKGYRYSWRQFLEAYRITQRYYSRKYRKYEQR